MSRFEQFTHMHMHIVIRTQLVILNLIAPIAGIRTRQDVLLLAAQLGLAATPRSMAAFSVFSHGKGPLLLIIIHACSPTAQTMSAYLVKPLILIFRSLPDKCDLPGRPANARPACFLVRKPFIMLKGLYVTTLPNTDSLLDSEIKSYINYLLQRFLQNSIILSVIYWRLTMSVCVFFILMSGEVNQCYVIGWVNL